MNNTHLVLDTDGTIYGVTDSIETAESIAKTLADGGTVQTIPIEFNIFKEFTNRVESNSAARTTQEIHEAQYDFDCDNPAF